MFVFVNFYFLFYFDFDFDFCFQGEYINKIKHSQSNKSA